MAGPDTGNRTAAHLLQSPRLQIKRCRALSTEDLVGSTQASPFSRGTEYLIEDGAGEHAIEKAIRDLYTDAHLRPVIDSLLAREAVSPINRLASSTRARACKPVL